MDKITKKALIKLIHILHFYSGDVNERYRLKMLKDEIKEVKEEVRKMKPNLTKDDIETLKDLVSERLTLYRGKQDSATFMRYDKLYKLLDKLIEIEESTEG